MNYLFLDNGFEEIEAITTIDLLRRANIALTTVSITGNPMVLGAHNIAVEADGLIDKIDFSDAEMLILPGGQTKLGDCSALRELLIEHNKADKPIAAICAAPSVLGTNGLLKGRKATCFPGFEDKLEGAEKIDAGAVRDENIVTGKSMGSAVTFGLKVVETLIGKDAADKVEASIYRG